MTPSPAHGKRLLPLLGILLLGMLIFSPLWDFHLPLSTGDNGRDLYCFRQTLNGALPYRDYWWVYGPIMPAYYAFWFQLLGTNIKTVLMAESLFYILSGSLIFLILRRRAPLLLSISGALWFWTFNPRFTYTYNHAAGVTVILGLVGLLFHYLRYPRRRYLIGGFGLLFILGLIKLNIGLANLAAFLVSFFLIRRAGMTKDAPRHGRILFIGALVLLVLLLAVYATILSGLPVYAARQCMPFLTADRADHAPFLLSVWWLLLSYLDNISHFGPNMAFGIIILVALGRLLMDLIVDIKKHQNISTKIIHLIIPCIFWLFNLHEYLLSGVPYRLFWVTPLQFLLIFAILAQGTKSLSRPLQNLIHIALFSVIILSQISLNLFIRQFKIPDRYLDMPAGHVYAGNSPAWFQTVRSVVTYLNRHLAEDETFLALPYEPLYHFLTNRASPTRQLYVFEYLNIPPEQEARLITAAGKTNVRFIVLSNRGHSSLKSLGIFGQTYVRDLAAYIQQHYQLVATFGDWEQPGGALDNHAVRIFRRK